MPATFQGAICAIFDVVRCPASPASVWLCRGSSSVPASFRARFRSFLPSVIVRQPAVVRGLFGAVRVQEKGRGLSCLSLLK